MYPQSQRIRLRLTIKKIAMNLKFPCSLTAQLKHDSIYDCKKQYELRNGECNINEQIDSELNAPYNVGRARFQDKKIIVNVFMSSSSGKVAAGCISFSLLGKQAGSSYDNVQFVEKCPDKQAKLYYNFSFQLVGKGERMDTTIIGSLRANQRKNDQYEGRESEGYNSSRSPPSPRTMRMSGKQINRFSANKQSERLSVNKQMDRSRHNKSNLHESHVQQVFTMQKRDSRNAPKDVGYNTRELAHERNSLRTQQRSRSRSLKKLNDDNLSSRQLPYPPMRININDSKQIYRDEGDNEELENLRNKIKNLQRNDRTNVQILRESKDEAERKKNKISQLQIVRAELEQTIRVKDQKLRKVEKQQKQLSQQCESLSNQLKNAKTQGDLRENMSRQQIRKLQEKHRQSESERQRIVQEYNRSLKLYEEMEKKYQGTMKQKERAFVQEKAKFNKKIETLNTSLDESKREIDLLKNDGEEFMKQKRGLLQGHKELVDEIEQYRGTVQQLQGQLKSQAELIKQLRNEAEAFALVEVERQQSKKKINELLLANNIQLEKIAKIEKTVEQLESKIKQQEDELQRRGTDKNQLNLKLVQLKKNYDALRQSEQQKIKENDSLILQQNAANSRVNELKGRLEVDRRNLEQTQREYSSRESALLAEKESVEGECEQLRWQLQKQASALQELNMHSRSQNQQIYKLKEELIDKMERMKRLEDENSALSTQQEHLTGNCTQIDSQRKEQLTTIKEQTAQIAELKKKQLKTEQELNDVREKLKTLEVTGKEKQNDYERKVKEWENNIKGKEAAIRSLEDQLKDRGDEVTVQRQSNTLLGQDIIRSKDLYSGLRKEMEGQEVILIKLKQSENELRKGIQARDEALDRKGKQLEEMSRKIGKLTEEYTQYKTNILGTMESFILQLLKQEEVASPTSRSPRKVRATFPDDRLSNLELEFAQKRHQQATKAKAKILQSTQQRQILQYELSRVKANHTELQQSHAKELNRVKEQIKMLQAEILSKEEAHKETLFKVEQELEGKLSELQEAKRQLLKANDHVQDLQSQQRILQTKCAFLKDQNKECEQRMIILRSTEIKNKPSVDHRVQQLEGHSSEQLQNYRRLLHDSEKKIKLQDKEIHERTEVIKRFQAELSIKGFELEKAENKVSEWTQRANSYQSALNQSERYGKEKDRELKKISDTLDQVSVSLNQEKQKSQHYLQEKDEQIQIVAGLTQDIQKLKDEMALITAKATESENQFKSKLQSLKVSNDKLLLEIKQLKEKAIAASSQIQLKKFMVRQAQISSTLQRQAKNQMHVELQKRKVVIIKLQEQIASHQNRYIEMEQKHTLLQQQRDGLESIVQRNKETVQKLKNSMDNLKGIEQVMSLERQIDKLRSDKADIEQYYERQLIDLKNMLKESKKMDNSRSTREQELKKKVRMLEKMLEGQDYDIANEKRKLIQEIERQRKEMLTKVSGPSTERDQVEKSASVVKANSLKLRYEKESDRLNKEIQDLTEQLTARDFIIKNQQHQFDYFTARLNEATANVSKIEAQLEQERAKNKRQHHDFQAELKLAQEKQAKIQEQQLRTITQSIDRKIGRIRSKKLDGSSSELQRTILTSSYRQISEVINEVKRELSP